MKQLVLTHRAARWLHALVHTQGLGVQVADLDAAKEAVHALNAYVEQLGISPRHVDPLLVNGRNPEERVARK